MPPFRAAAAALSARSPKKMNCVTAREMNVFPNLNHFKAYWVLPSGIKSKASCLSVFQSGICIVTASAGEISAEQLCASGGRDSKHNCRRSLLENIFWPFSSSKAKVRLVVLKTGSFVGKEFPLSQNTWVHRLVLFMLLFVGFLPTTLSNLYPWGLKGSTWSFGLNLGVWKLVLMLLRMFWFKPQNPKLVLMLLRMFIPPVWKQNQLCVLCLVPAAEVQPQGFNCFWVTSFTSDALSCVICCSCRILGSEWALAGSVLPPHRVVSSDSAGSARDLLQKEVF